MVEMPDYTLIGSDGPIRLVDIFQGRSQLVVYNHMGNDGEEWQCGVEFLKHGCARNLPETLPPYNSHQWQSLMARLAGLTAE